MGASNQMWQPERWSLALAVIKIKWPQSQACWKLQQNVYGRWLALPVPAPAHSSVSPPSETRNHFNGWNMLQHPPEWMWKLEVLEGNFGNYCIGLDLLDPLRWTPWAERSQLTQFLTVKHHCSSSSIWASGQGVHTEASSPYISKVGAASGLGC